MGASISIYTSRIGAYVAANRTKAITRYGNNDAMRASPDLSRVLISKKLAARIALLRDDEWFSQRPAFEDKKRVFGALTFEPFKSTSLRGDCESGNTRANRPINSLPFNAVADAWMKARRPSYD